MLLAIIIALIILWLIGLVAHIAGAFIHLLLLIVLVIIIYDFVTERRRP